MDRNAAAGHLAGAFSIVAYARFRGAVHCCCRVDRVRFCTQRKALAGPPFLVVVDRAVPRVAARVLAWPERGLYVQTAISAWLDDGPPRDRWSKAGSERAGGTCADVDPFHVAKFRSSVAGCHACTRCSLALA